MRRYAGDLKLHLGCGSTVVDGWENIDKSPNVHLARMPRLRTTLARARVLTEEQATAVFPPGIVRTDIRRGIPYADNSARFLYSSHLIEHLSRWQALELLGECRRVLAPGGLIRIATPDLAQLVDEYRAGATGRDPTAADSFMRQLETFREAPGSIAQRLIRRLLTAPHQWLYDETSLSHLLAEAGFVEATRYEHHEGDFPDLEQLEIRPGSLVVQSRRP
jgi:predicted SAM-dependent methyltransferase